MLLLRTTRAGHRRASTWIALVLALLGTLLPAAQALAAPAEPSMVPSNGYRDLRDNSPQVTFGGSIDAAGGWRYRENGQTSGQAFARFKDAAGQPLVSDDLTQAVSVAADGTISGSTTLNTTLGPRAQAKSVELVVRVTRSGEEAFGDSQDLLIDRDVPNIAAFALVAADVVQVSFTEEVTSSSGDSRRDWTVEDAVVTGVRQPTDGDLRVRFLDLLSDQPDGATPEVRYAPGIGNARYTDFAGRVLGAANNPGIAGDEIPPPLPRIVTIDGVAPSSGVTVRGADRPEVVVDRVVEGHTVELWRDGLVDETRTLDTQPGGPDHRLATTTVPAGASQVTFSPGDYSETLPPDVDHTLFVRAIDSAGNESVTSTRYRVDPSVPRVVPPAVADGEFVVVGFSEAVIGPNEAAEWAVSSGVPAVSVSGSGDSRVIRFNGTPSGQLTYDPAKGSGPGGLTDSAGNAVTGFPVPITTSGAVTLTAGPATTEGSPLTFTVGLARGTSTKTYTVDYVTEPGTATAGTDFTSQSGRLTFAGDEETKTVSVATLKDDLTEGDETVRLRLSRPTNGATLPADPTATGTIRDPSTTPTVSVFDSRANEGATARALVQLSAKTSRDVTVAWRTEDGSARTRDDFGGGSGTIRIRAGATEAEILVPVLEDDLDEPTETFSIVLSSPTNATLGRSRADVSILDGAGVPGGVGRVAGASRVETSVEVSRTFFATADTVVIATANAYPDALAGAPLAAANDAPIILTTPDALHPVARGEVARLGAKTAIVLGGGKALSAKVDDDLRAAGVRTVRRIAGANRFETAQRIAAELGADAVYVVEGANADPRRGWPDAVAVSALAAAQQRPILLVERDRLPSETRSALRSLAPSRATIVGGTAAVNDAVAKAVDAEAGTVNRISGRTRYETSAAVGEASKQAGLTPANTWFATGDDWPDSLSASPAVARTGGILLLVDSDRLDDSPPARDWLVRHRSVLESITLVGGTKAISAGVEAQIRSQSGLSAR